MISYKESQNILQEAARGFPVRPPESFPIEEAVGRVLVEDIHAREESPPFDNSAMDGFAIRNEILDGLTTEAWLPVEGLIAAGANALEFSDAKIIEIMTGAPLPPGDFTVIRIEDVEVKDEKERKYLRPQKIPKPGENIRRAGEDSRKGDLLLAQGSVLNERHLLIFASQGIAQVLVGPRLKIAVLSTGRELVDYRRPDLKPGEIRNSTAPFLLRLLNTPLAQADGYGIVEDNQKSFLEVLGRILDADSEIIVSTGAVSMGVFDFVRPALEEMGARIHFHKCAIRPGKPILFAEIEHKGKRRFFFGMPGNPVSTAVGFYFFLKPFIQWVHGLKPDRPRTARLSADVEKPEGLKCFLKAFLNIQNGDAVANVLKGQASFMVSPFGHANAWVLLAEEGKRIPKDSIVEVIPL